jgi:Ca-activated chloride channel family protein
MRRVALPAAALAMLAVVLLLVASALARPAPAPAAGQVRVEQVDSARFPEVTLYVSALDESGRPRPGFAPADFAVAEDGVPVAISGFGGLGGEPVSSVLVVDRSGSMEDAGKLDGARAAAAAFVALMRPQDRAAIVAFNDEVRLAQGFTADTVQLDRAIERLRADDGTALYDAVVAGVDLLRDQPGRRLLLVLSDGQDLRESPDADLRPYGSERTLDEAVAYAVAAGQPVAVVGLGQRAAAGEDGVDEATLREIAADTGGQYFYAPRAADLAALYADLAESVQREYRLTYVSPRQFYDGTRRDIAVTVGGVAAAGAYTERHLINVVSSPVAGVVLLLPLAALLALPALARRRGVAGSPAPADASAQPEGVGLLTAPAPAVPGVPAGAPGPSAIFAGARRCERCDTQLRPAARFCPRCGAAQGEAR